MAHCRVCGEFDGLTFTCNYCGLTHCVNHRLPEKHVCPALRRRPTKRDAKKEIRSREGGAVGLGPEFPRPDPPPAERRDALADRLPPNAYRFFERVGEAVTLLIVVPIGLAIHLVTFLLTARGLAVVLVGAFAIGGYSAAVGTGIGLIDDTVDDVTDGAADAVSPYLNSSERSTATPSGDGVGVSNADGEATPASSTTGGNGQLDRTRIAVAVHEAVNEERRARQLFPLAYDENLERIARYHSGRMADEDFFSHTAPDGETMSDRYDRFQYHCRARTGSNTYATGAENIAYTYANANVVADDGTIHNHRNNETAIGYGLVRQWMNSDGHRENILRDYWDDEGVGIAFRETDSGTRVYATQNFC